MLPVVTEHDAIKYRNGIVVYRLNYGLGDLGFDPRLEKGF
jgi:hypothetical protein